MAGHNLSVETNTFVESTKQNVEFKNSLCGSHEIIAQDGKKKKVMAWRWAKRQKTSTQPPLPLALVVSLFSTGNAACEVHKIP